MIASPFDGRNLLQVIPYVFRQLVNNNRVGTWCVLVQQTVGTGNTVLTHNLARVPQGYYATRNSSGGVLFDATTGVAAWTDTSITIRATVAGVYDIWIY